jgi:Ni/Fe-hydrogenase 1 B-type cytochrome subunit
MAIAQPLEREHIYVWQAPVRLAHWVHVGAMLILAVTGFYIGRPFLVAAGNVATQHVMGSMRMAHAITATFLGISFVTRAYWALVGNRYARFSGLLPFTRRRWRDFWRMMAYYTFLSNKRPEYLGHNPVAGLSYFALYFLVFLEGLTGLALYAEYFPGGLMYALFGWVWALGANSNIVRLVHHLLMWVFVAFFLLHVYLAVLNDLIEGSGVNSSIITGYKN